MKELGLAWHRLVAAAQGAVQDLALQVLDYLLSYPMVEDIIAEYLVPAWDYVEAWFHTTAYYTLNYYDSEDLWIRLYLGAKDWMFAVLGWLEAGAALLGSFIPLDSFVGLVIGRVAVYGSLLALVVSGKRIWVGVGATVLVVILSPFMLVILVVSKIIKAANKLLKKKSSKKDKK